MRADLDAISFTETELADYIYGSAEVIGLMCLRIFLHGHTVDPVRLQNLERGARSLGAAFQKINFLRDLSADINQLGRHYFSNVDDFGITRARKRELVAEIRSDLQAAAVSIPLLPRSCRRAVGAAHALFTEVLERIERMPAEELMITRVSVPAPVKLRLLAAALVARARGGR